MRLLEVAVTCSENPKTGLRACDVRTSPGTLGCLESREKSFFRIRGASFLVGEDGQIMGCVRKLLHQAGIRSNLFGPGEIDARGLAVTCGGVKQAQHVEIAGLCPLVASFLVELKGLEQRRLSIFGTALI